MAGRLLRLHTYVTPGFEGRVECELKGGCGWVGVVMIRLAVEVVVESLCSYDCDCIFGCDGIVMIVIVDLVVMGSLWL